MYAISLSQKEFQKLAQRYRDVLNTFSHRLYAESLRQLKIRITEKRDDRLPDLRSTRSSMFRNKLDYSPLSSRASDRNYINELFTHYLYNVIYTLLALQ